MKPIDFLKAAGIAIGLLVINVLIAILVVGVYAALIEPGHTDEFYDEAALWIVPWSCHIIGTPLFFVAVCFLTARRRERNAYLFATVVVVMYAIIDAASVGFLSVLELSFALSMLLKLAASLTAAYVGTRSRQQVSSASTQ